MHNSSIYTLVIELYNIANDMSPEMMSEVFKGSDTRYYNHAKFTVFYKSNSGLLIQYVRKILCKTNISYPLIRTHTLAYERKRNISFSKHFAYVLNDLFVVFITELNQYRVQDQRFGSKYLLKLKIRNLLMILKIKKWKKKSKHGNPLNVYVEFVRRFYLILGLFNKD